MLKYQRLQVWPSVLTLREDDSVGRHHRSLSLTAGSEILESEHLDLLIAALDLDLVHPLQPR